MTSLNIVVYYFLEKEILQIKDIKEAEVYTLYINSEC